MQLQEKAVKVISAEKLDGGTRRIMVEIKGHLFKRLSYYNTSVYWYDEYGTFNDRQAMQPEQEKELEAIFKAWMIENKTNETKLLNNKQ